METFVEAELFDADELDYNDFTKSQKEAFAELLRSMKASDKHMVPDYYRWKYHTPAGQAKIAVVREGHDIVASVSMLPLTMSHAGDTIVAWQCLDTATVPKARGKGYFNVTGRALLDAVPEGELSYGFPNKNVIRGWNKSGWTYKQLITTWICPVSSLFRWDSKRIEAIQKFDERQDHFFRSLPNDTHPLVERTSSYLNWRYIDHPVYNYVTFAYIKDGQILGTVVAREAVVMNRNAVLVMDLLGINPRIERALLRKVCSYAASHRCPFVVMLDSGISKPSAIASGFVPVWSKLLPKQQIVMGNANSGEIAQRIYRRNWRIQLGDWDVF